MGGCLSGLKGKLHSLKPTVSYEWVLKKKHNWGHKDSWLQHLRFRCPGLCDRPGRVSPAAQSVSPAGQYAAPTYGTGQHASLPIAGSDHRFGSERDDPGDPGW